MYRPEEFIDTEFIWFLFLLIFYYTYLMKLRGVDFSEINEIIRNTWREMPNETKEVYNRRAKSAANPDEQ